MSVERVTLEPVGDLESLGQRWRALERSCDGGFFRSWTFLGCEAPTRLAGAHLLSVTQDGADMVLGLLGGKRGRLWLNETGVPALDTVFIEHNGLLVRRGQQHAAVLALRRAARSAVSVTLSGVDSATLAAARKVGWVAVQQSRLAPCVALHALTAPFLDTLSASARAQIRRSYRAYGPSLLLARADTVQCAQRWFQEMVALHQDSWTRRGRPGAFASPEMQRFHTALIDRAWEAGEIDLLRIDANGNPVGILYMFRRGGRVLSYQSGFSYNPGSPREKPGLVCHTLAIEHYAARGAHSYDLLAGADRYKLTLAPEGEVLHWATLYRTASARGMAATLKTMARTIVRR